VCAGTYIALLVMVVYYCIAGNVQFQPKPFIFEFKFGDF